MKAISTVIWSCFWCWTLTNINYVLLLQINSNGGYNEIVIALSPAIQQQNGENIINKIKTLLQKTSDLLYKASNNRFYFNSATILIPETWTVSPLWNITNGPQLYKNADVRIVENSVNGHESFIATQQTTECRKPGDFIQIESGLFANWAQTKKKQDKRTSYLFLRHWAQYRFGIFEETGIKDSLQFPLFYRSENQWKMTGCEHPYPWIYNVNSDCSSTMNVDICQFELSQNTKVNSSIMSSNGTIQAPYFCSSQLNVHNAKAPTPQNAFCKHKSTWQVITESKDFKAVTSPIKNPKSVEIKVRKRGKIKMIIVVDSELCQLNKDEKRTFTVASSVAKLINDFLITNPIGVMISNEIIHDVKNLPTHNIANIFYDKCKSNHVYTRNIEESLKTAANMIQTSSEDTETLGNIILIADGRNTRDNDLHNFLYQKQNTNIHLHLISYPAQKEEFTSSVLQYSNLYIQTVFEDQGRPTSDTCDTGARVQFDQIFNSISDHYNNFNTKTILFSEPIYGNVNSKSGKIIFPFNGNVNIQIYLCKPVSGHDFSWNEKYLFMNYDKNGNFLSNTIVPKTTPTINNYTFNTGGSYSVGYALTFWVVGKREEIELDTSIDIVQSPKQNVILPPLLRVSTNLNNPYVTATVVELTEQNPKTVILRRSPEEERGAIFKETYSLYFLNMASKPSTYSVTFTFTDNTDPTKITYKLQSSTVFSSNFTNKDMSNFPPNRITDFKIEAINLNQLVAIFTWTAPGANFDTGTATAYYLRCETTVGTSNDNGYVRLLKDPSMSGYKETYLWKAKDPLATYYCSIKSEASRMSEPSNTAVVFFYIDIEPPTPSGSGITTTGVSPDTSNDPKILLSSSNEGLIGGILGALLFLVIVAFIVFVCYWRRQKQRRKTIKPEISNPIPTVSSEICTESNHRQSSGNSSRNSLISNDFQKVQYYSKPNNHVHANEIQKSYDNQLMAQSPKNEVSEFIDEVLDDSSIVAGSVHSSKTEPTHYQYQSSNNAYIAASEPMYAFETETSADFRPEMVDYHDQMDRYGTNKNQNAYNHFQEYDNNAYIRTSTPDLHQETLISPKGLYV